MKKFIFLFFISLSLCVSCDPPATRPYHHNLPPDSFSFIPEKDVYKVGDMVQVKIVIPKKIDRYNITEITFKHYDELVFEIKKNKENNINFLLNDVSVEEGKITFVYDKEKEKYFLKDKISIVFLKAGEFNWNSFFKTISRFFVAPNININSHKLFIYDENKTFKVEP